jgi:hypothetical protein
MVRRWRGQKRVRTYRNQLSLTLATRLAADPDMLECTSVRLYLWIPEAPVNMHESLRQGTGEVLRWLLSYSFPLTSHILQISVRVPGTSLLLADSREM